MALGLCVFAFWSCVFGLQASHLQAADDTTKPGAAENPDRRQQRYERIQDIRSIMSGIARDAGDKPIVRIPPAYESMPWLKESLDDLKRLKEGKSLADVPKNIVPQADEATKQSSEVQAFAQMAPVPVSVAVESTAAVAAPIVAVADVSAPAKPAEDVAALPGPLSEAVKTLEQVVAPQVAASAPAEAPVAPVLAPVVSTAANIQTGSLQETAPALATPTAPVYVPEYWQKMNQIYPAENFQPVYRDHLTYKPVSDLNIAADLESFWSMGLGINEPSLQ